MLAHSPQNSLFFTPIHRLLTDRSDESWEIYWRSCAPHSHQLPKFMDIVRGYVYQIKTNKAEKILLINEDIRLFLAGFLAALTADVPIILPPTNTPDIIEKLCDPSTLLLNDEAPAIQMNHPVILNEINPVEAKIIFFTSGSTGMPKAIKKSLLQIETEITCLEQCWGTDKPSCRFLSTVPHHHIYGLLFSLLWPVCAGYPINLGTTHFWEDVINAYSPGDTLISGPSHLGRLSPFLLDSSPLKFGQIFSSGAPLSYESAQNALNHLGILPTEILGSTETGGIAFRQQDCNEALWTPFPNIRLKTNKESYLSLNSPFLSNTDDFPTQDRIHLNENQTFTLLSRGDRIVKIEGKRISLDEIENNLTTLEEISHVRIIPLLRSNDTSFYKDELAAIAILSPLGIAILEKIGKIHLRNRFQQHLKTICEPVTIPRRWRFVTELPITDTGKITLQACQNLFNQNKGDAS